MIDSIELKNSETQQFLIKANYYIIGIGGLFIFTIGILTNILNLIILSRKSMKSTTNKYLIALAISDLFVLILSQLTLSNSFIKDYKDTPFFDTEFHTKFDEHLFYKDYFPTNENLTLNETLNSSLFNNNVSYNNLTIDESATSSHLSAPKNFFSDLYNTWSTKIYPYLFPYAFPLAIMFQISTVWINLGMTFDRFVAIHFPLKSLKFCTISKAKKLISSIFLFSFVYSLPRFFEYKVISQKHSITFDHNETSSFEIVYFTFTEFGQSRLFRRVVYFWMYILLQSIAPLVILFLLNLALIISLKKSKKMLNSFNEFCEKSPGSKNKKSRHLKELNQKNITIMLITVIVSFIICQTPAAICNCVHGYSSLSTSLNTVCYVGNFFILTCSTTNFFSYCVFNKRFRKELGKMAGSVCCFMMPGVAYKRFSLLTSSAQNSVVVKNALRLKQYENNKASMRSYSRFNLEPCRKQQQSVYKASTINKTSLVSFIKRKSADEITKILQPTVRNYYELSSYKINGKINNIVYI